MEFGDPARNIPARPSLIPGVTKIIPDAVAKLKKAGEKALEGKKSDIEAALKSVGVIGQRAVRAKITDGPFQPLAQATIEARARRGRKGAKKFLKQQAKAEAGRALGWEGTEPDASLVKPLIDTGQFRQSINFVVRKKGEK